MSGAAALIRDWYTREHGRNASIAGTDQGDPGQHRHRSRGRRGRQGDEVGPAPNVDQGWGRAASWGGARRHSAFLLDQSIVFGSTGARFARSYAVADSTRPLKVTLAWTDAPGMVSTEAFVNDLDLVVRQGGRTYRGNVIAGRTLDHRRRRGPPQQPRERGPARRCPGAAFSVEVLGTNLAGDGVPGNGDATDQDFALVVSNAQAQSAPVLAPDSVTVHDRRARGRRRATLSRASRSPSMSASPTAVMLMPQTSSGSNLRARAGVLGRLDYLG